MSTTNDWESWIGRSTTAEAWLDPGQANLLCVTLSRDPAFREGDVLPLAWHWIYFHEAVRSDDLADEGHPRLGINMPPVPLPRRMWAAGSFDVESRLTLGSRVERASTIQAITPKQGRTGPLFFVTVVHEFRSDGRTNFVEKQTIVYREMTSAEAPGPPPAAPTDADFSATWDLDEVSLFRYSALTFNAHRIHYDVDYARDVEGYPDLVVHGPLEATLLCDLLAAHDVPVRHFEYQAKSPLFLPHQLVTNAKATPGGAELWVSDEAGGLHMAATVTS